MRMLRLPHVVRLLLACLCLLLFTAPRGAQGAVWISEFMAANTSGLTDEDGDFSDWLELYNSGIQPQSLDGYYLTDDRNLLPKWRIPAITLAPHGRVVIFLSGKSRDRVPGELHANFQLSNDGEYLALIAPNGSTVVHAYTPSFPPQLDNVSFGLTFQEITTNLVSATNAVRWRVPAAASDLPAGWAAPGFDDSGWATGRLPLGYDTGQNDPVVLGAPPPVSTNLALRKISTQSSSLGGFSAGVAVDGSVNNFSHTLAGQNLPATWTVDLGTNCAIQQIFLYNRPDCCGSRLRDIQVMILDVTGTKTNFISPLLNPENILGGGGLDGPGELPVDLIELTGGVVIGGRVRVVRIPDPDLSGTHGQGTQDEPDVLSLAEVEVLGVVVNDNYDTLVQTDLESAMLGKNASAFARIPFVYSSSAFPSATRLRLRMKSDDGFIAYLNGVEIARRNAPDPAAWNSTATAGTPSYLATQFEDIDISSVLGQLLEGTNVLAIQGLNLTRDDPEFLILPELVAGAEVITSDRFLATPTPGEANSEGFTGVIAPVRFSHDHGFFETSFDLLLSCDSQGVEIRYTTNGDPPSPTNGTVYAGPVTIQRTTVVRAGAFRTGYRPAEILTRTFLFLDDVIRQTPQTTLAAGFPTLWGGVSADYGLDPRVVGQNGTDSYGGRYASSIKQDLKSIPTLSIVMKTSEMFGPEGIYSQSGLRGATAERLASAEFFDPNDPTGDGGFQVNCGLRLQGGAFRSDGLTKKHSLRLLFRGEYGASKLRYPIYGADDASDSLDTITLRANSNDGWQWSGAGGRALYIRDSFARTTLLDMGGVSSHERFVHLYINGVYWGLYDAVERPDASFSSTYFGGEKEDWDAISVGGISNGSSAAWETMNYYATLGLGSTTNYQRIQGRRPDGTPDPSMPNYLDVENLIDYMIANLFVGNQDWPGNNWWVGRRVTDSTGFKFYVWDAEWSLALSGSDVSIDVTGVAGGVATAYGACRANPEFRVAFGDHLHRHFFNGGALYVDPLNPQYDPAHPERNRPAARFAALATRVESAIVPESARWGDQHTAPSLGYTRDEHWRAERDSILRNYLTARSGIVLSQFRSAGLYPQLIAPSFNKHGGEINPGFPLTMFAPLGIIYYTTNGSDPRLVGGAVAPDALVYSGAVNLTDSVKVRARVFNTNNWSAMNEAIFVTRDPIPLRVTELMYHPATAAGSTNSVDDFEFVEVKNLGARPLNLLGFRFDRGITFTFPNLVLGPGALTVVVRNRAAALSRYAATIPIAGEFTGNLRDSGERLRLLSPLGQIVHDFSYGNWSPLADGLGFSLVPVNDQAPADLWSEQSTWRTSTAIGGSPGLDDPAPIIPRVLVNEVLPRPVSGGDAIELYNPNSTDVNIGGWFLTDDPKLPRKYRIPNGAGVPAHGYALFKESAFKQANGSFPGFSLSAKGEAAYLFSADNSGNLTGFAHGFEFGPAAVGVSFGRHVITTGEEHFPAQNQLSLLDQNSAPLVGPIVISEIAYRPAAGDDEFVELRNITAFPVPLYDPSHPTNTWKVNGLGFTFPTEVLVPPNGTVLLVRADPAAFRARHEIPEDVLIFTYRGALQASGESLQLLRPDLPDGDIPYILVDAVRYRSRLPWPIAADGIGPSLQRLHLAAYGDDPANWGAARPTPGSDIIDGPPPVITSGPQSRTVVAYTDTSFSVQAEGSGQLRYQWRFASTNLPGATNAVLTLTNVQPAQAGDYVVVVFNDSGAAPSSPASLFVNLPPVITQQPTNQLVFAGSNTTFTVAAFGTGPLRYQWRRDGIPIPNATGVSFSLFNVQPTNDGLYSVVITDDIGPATSLPGRLNVLIRPTILSQPKSQEAVIGDTVTLRIVATGHPLPLGYRWRRNGATIVGQTNATLRLVNVQATNAGTYTVVVTNLASFGTAGLLSSSAVLTVLADSDGDHIPDVWETPARGLDPTKPGDALLDFDGDHFTNLQEYIAGTDPQDPLDFLKVEQLAAGSGGATISFRAVANKTYGVLFRDGPAAEGWLTLTNLPSSPTNRLQIVIDPALEPARFYRLVTPAQE